MKKCPKCNRTYSDEEMSFCLDDGSLLAAFYDPEATVEIRTKDTSPENTAKVISKDNIAEEALGVLASFARKRTTELEKKRQEREEDTEPELNWRDTLRAMLTFDVFGTGRKKRKK